MAKNAKAAPAPMLRGERSLEFFNGQFVYRWQNEHGDQFKFLSPAAVAEALRKAPVDSGWLPPGVARCGGSARGDFAVMFIPAARHLLFIERKRGAVIEKKSVWLPSLVFFGFGRKYYVWAMKGAELQPTGELFRAPLPNVFEDSSICWGQNSPPRASGATIAQAWQLFITSPFNQHAAGSKTRSKEFASDVRVLLWKLARSKQKFPLAELVPTRQTANTLDAVVGSLIGGRNGH